ncbi:MAG: endolytic transglycosylase MltG [Cyanobacteria bacterium P01_H01_bin.121]
MRTTGQRYWLTSIVIAIIAAVGGWQGWAWWSWASSPVAGTTRVASEQLLDDTSAATTIQLQIPTGTSGQAIGDRLAAAGLIRSASAWSLWSSWLGLQQRLTGAPGGFQAGVYTLSTAQSMPEIAAMIWQGDTTQLQVTIPEGWSRQQMAAYFEAQGLFSSDAFLAATREIPYDRFPWLPSRLPFLEGFLYPDTYAVDYATTTPAVIIDQMLQQFETVALPIYETQPHDLTLMEWVTLASIVEKEAVVPVERSLIAGVLFNRLEQDIPLGVDPTVEYGLGFTQTPDQPLTFEEVRTPSPYNTYLITGLPPTPIASPGADSLTAVLQPEATDYLYFVARYDGTHVFSYTLAEHEAAQQAIHDARSARPGAPLNSDG